MNHKLSTEDKCDAAHLRILLILKVFAHAASLRATKIISYVLKTISVI